MNTKTIFPDDPRLTAYALGEMSDGERREFEAQLARDPVAQHTVAEIRALGGQLAAALAAEPMPEASAPPATLVAEAAIVAGPDLRNLDGGITRRFRSSQLYYLAGGLAAAGFVALIAVKGPEFPAATKAERRVEPAGPTAGSATMPKVHDARLAGRPDATTAPAAVAQTRVPESAADMVTAPITPPTGATAAGPNVVPVSNGIASSQPVSSNAGSSIAPSPAAESSSATPPLGDNRPRTTPTRPAAPSLAAGLVAQSEALHEAAANGLLASPVPLSVPASAMHFSAAPSQLQGEVRRSSEREARDRRVARATQVRAELQRGGAKGVQRGEEFSFVDASASAGSAPTADQSSLAPGNEVPLVSSPFMVEAPASQGYIGTTTLAGSRSGGTRAFNTESYAYRPESDFVSVAAEPLSTFSADVDTASYGNVRRFIAHGELPPPDAVRIEELLNAFTYDYARPAAAAANARSEGVPFAADLEVASAPWAPAHRLVRIGIRGRDTPVAARGAANLVFLLDVSGSMVDENKLPLVKQAMRLLLTRLRADDHVAIVTYAGTSGLALPSTPLTRRQEIEQAIEALSAGGSTNGALGIQLAYDVAKANFVAGGVNRVILCTDGDFNVGTTSEGSLVRLIKEKAGTGVFLSVFGFGMGNLKDSMLQQVADAGNGNYGYIDTLAEAERRLVGQVNGTLVTIAKDVKLQVEFNPAKVWQYRLIGYEKRRLAAADFKNDAVDAGEIGAGHTVTALYEIEPAKGNPAVGGVADESQPQRYVDFATAPASRGGTAPASAAQAGELLTVRIRYKQPDGLVSRKLEFPLTDADIAFEQASPDFKFASAVAAFGMILRDSSYKGTATFAAVTGWAESGIVSDPDGSRTQFVELIRQAQALRR